MFNSLSRCAICASKCNTTQLKLRERHANANPIPTPIQIQIHRFRFRTIRERTQSPIRSSILPCFHLSPGMAASNAAVTSITRTTLQPLSSSPSIIRQRITDKLVDIAAFSFGLPSLSSSSSYLLFKHKLIESNILCSLPLPLSLSSF